MITPEELHKLAQSEREAQQFATHTLNVCMAASCVSMQSDKLKEALDKEIAGRGLKDHCKVRGVGCMGLCMAGPLVSVDGGQSGRDAASTVEAASSRSSGTLYQHVTPGDAAEIVDHLGQAPIQRMECDAKQPFFAHQTKIVLENAGVIDSERIEEYIGAGGYEALSEALTAMSPSDVIRQVTVSGLRGRGGAGFPAGLKWSTVAKANPGAQKYVICNADEGDPGAFMDRSVLESDPHRVLEGMAIAGYAVGANKGYIYVRAEYPLAVSRLQKGIKQAERMGLLGNAILGTTFNFSIEIRLGAGAFVCGEETALIASVEGRRGQPRPRPPYPAEVGLWGGPTLINNVETFANIAPILRKGGEWFAKIGSPDSKGTKVFALAGRIKNAGVIEVPMGMTLREIIFDIGGGIPEGKKFKAVQTGGPSGGCIPEQFLDMPVDYESLTKAGSIMGSGGMIVMDETSCMVDVAKYFMDFCMAESCGKCIPCRVGTTQMHGLLEKITSGCATEDDLGLLEELCEMVRNTSLCGLGMTAPNPVMSTLRYFRDEYLAHIRGKCCPAGVCKIGKEHALV